MAFMGRPTWVDDKLFPFESRFVDIDGHTVHYVDEGSGPTLLFLHGNPTWSFDYRRVVESLKREFRCVAVDYPGFGLSVAAPGYRYLPADHAQVIERFVAALGLNGITLVAHDWGGPIGLAAVQRHPGIFDRLVLTNTWAWPVSDPVVQLMSHVLGSPMGRLLIRQLNLFVNLMIPIGHRLAKPTAEQMAHYRKALDSPARREASAVFPREITSSRAFLAEIEARLTGIAALPALIIWGDADFAFGDKELRRWERTFTDHKTVIVEGAGHFVPSDAPEQFAAAIRGWHP
ncbi:alpha/beta fold hydrolase [Mycobacteroides immunogenum]|uniref:Alpha/beta hydrolase n=1 Tax=Mycobacteroides immunogenum TaxID=83262 RepID=A0A7V8RXW9_9MYCO|nr:alpha/beta fold hydrolase [Mycobacteroides immunogenum]AMT71624.1 alpha/beta hydrolase [Mycobacteroides immunogenum]ANO04744.1 alpha/beta hydrolase [Mycobacteroides immunogenum]KIU40005.1 alpha/beta hydrolase [Mycobacteroides immunogenum]KPG15228.1 alpha/beta hydrolase [Mycobacteroides immunogenum]KPG15844.1 alpha/beta hydrolase [Mycobacteroides immunogenum]